MLTTHVTWAAKGKLYLKCVCGLCAFASYAPPPVSDHVTPDAMRGGWVGLESMTLSAVATFGMANGRLPEET